jgi:anti-anti-sigma regulatory factor
MEVVRKSQPTIATAPADAATPPKLTIEKFADGGVACLKFVGTIDESFEGKKVARTIEAATLVLDCGGVKKISSFGIREWVDFVSTATKQVQQTILIECAPKVVDQLNMVANFAGGGRVFSFYAPFRCDYCDSEHRVLLDVGKDFEAIKAMKLADRPCLTCKESMYFDEDGSTFFSYILQQGPFELDADVIAFLAAKLDYRVGTVDQKLRVDKIIEGRVTYIRIAGDLNNTFPRDKLAEGLEGTVILDITGVPRVEPAGAAEWRSFMGQVAPLVEQLLVAGVQPAVLEKLGGRDDLGAKGVVVDLVLPYTCNACGTTTTQSVDVAEHHEVLKFATAPEQRCPSCKAAMTCTASEQTMTVLPGLPKPALTKDLERTLAMLKARKIEKKVSTGLVPTQRSTGGFGGAPAAATSNSKAVPILLALVLLVVVAAGVVFYMKSTKDRGPGPYGAGPVVDRSAPARPAWITSAATLGAAYCSDDGGGIACVGVSMLSPSQDDAEDEASDAAIEAIAFELGKRITDKSWQTSVPPLYASARDAKLAALNRDLQSTQARRDVRDGRRAVTHALRGVESTAAGRYWEAFDARDGRRQVAFVQVKLPAGAVKTLTERYSKRESIEGATAVGFFPGLAWKFPKLDHGAVVVSLAPGVLQELGVAERYIVLAVGGRDVPDASALVKILGEERTMLSERGGSLRLLVQTDSGDPREFSRQIAGKPVETPTGTGSGGKRTNSGSAAGGTGGVNVWDRFGGNRGSGRDDPTQ